MRRDVDIHEISDGNLYTLNDLVKADCGNCIGCHDCCCSMGESIVLDPYDVYQLTDGLQMRFEQLLADKIELNVYNGMILPCLKMKEESDCCAFLNAEGRCSIHSFRPSICRLFPLGRFYEENGFRYFLQIHECRNQKRTKIKVKKWIDIPNITEHTCFIQKWHDFTNEVQDIMLAAKNEELFKKVNMFLLQHFYIEAYANENSFFEQFEFRLAKAKKIIKTLLK